MLLGLCLAIPASAETPQAPSGTVHHYEFPAIGTLIALTIIGVERALAARARDAVAAVFADLDQDWNAWKPSTLTRLNAALARGEGMALPQPMPQVLALAKDISARSGGLFDPGVGALVALWGFHTDARAATVEPAPDKIKAWKSRRPSIAALNISGNRAWSANRQLKLDMNGIAKGHGLDLARARLMALGVSHALIDAGGDVCAMGSKQGTPWHIGIRHPRADRVIATLALADGECAFSSGDYERYRGGPDNRRHHVLDPRSGRPAHGLVAATVLGRDGARTQPASSALMIAGGEQWRAMARALGVQRALVIDAQGHVAMTADMARTVRFP